MSLSRPPHRNAGDRRKSTRPRLEALEPRWTPSAGAVTALTIQAAAQYSFTTVNSFNGANGANPASPLAIDAHGNLFGTTLHGGSGQRGTIYAIPAGTRYVAGLASFRTQQGQEPAGSLVVDAGGNLLGTATGGGQSGRGTVFELVNGASGITRLGSFNGTGNGSTPTGGLAAGNQGSLYGTTRNGGFLHAGTVFVIDPGSAPLRTLAGFNGSNGSHPQGGLVRDAQGDLFGMTYSGGIKGLGTVFEVAAGSSAITRLASFNGSNGAHPVGALTIDAQGNLYGTTSTGGAAGLGNVFEVAAGSGNITPLASFTDLSGNKSSGALVRDAQGDLFGTAQLGGASNQGTVFEVVAGSGTAVPLVTFNGRDGAQPAAPLVRDPQGDLWGTTGRGGRQGKGTVFELSPGP